MPNRLAAETSPYLRQHAGNPVDWHPWGDEAFERARREDRPVLLSVGYSACHWCHVMAHESFENPGIAALMNDLFVCVKVDREERPDVDGIYMQAVQALTGHGGWPMTVFLTPDGLPYHGGTYYPPEDRLGMRGFPAVLRAAAAAYHERREDVRAAGERLREALAPPVLSGGAEPERSHLETAERNLLAEVDRRSGGFGGAPKFPHPAALDLMLLRHRRHGAPELWDAVVLTLDRMARGGIFDQLGGGFHRYSVDSRWAVPHFEKMLYDNAQLVPVYLHAFQMSGERRWRAVVERTLDYVLREMTLPGGAFASSQDADSEGEEGVFFVWTPAQLAGVLGGEDGALAARVFGVTERGNFEGGTSVLSLPSPLDEVARSLGVDEGELEGRVERIRSALVEARAGRVAPARDDKVITSWNALMLAALAEAGAALGRPDYVEAARRDADFLLGEARPGGALMRTWKDGRASIPAFLQDVAHLADALLTLYEATGEPGYFAAALDLCGDILTRFRDETGGLCDTAADGEALIVRPRTLDDNPIPAGQSSAARAMLRLHALTGDQRWRAAALDVIRPLAGAAARLPLALSTLGAALDLAVEPAREVAVAGPRSRPDTAALVEAVQRRYEPGLVLAWGERDGVPLLEDRGEIGGRAAAYVCEGFVCTAPVTDPAALSASLDRR